MMILDTFRHTHTLPLASRKPSPRIIIIILLCSGQMLLLLLQFKRFDQSYKKKEMK